MSTLGGASPGLQGPGLQGIAEPMYSSARGNACVACKSVRFEEVWTRARTTARVSDRRLNHPADGRFVTRCCLSRFPKPAVQISISGRSPNTKLGGFARGSLPRHWQADLAAEGGK